MSKTIWFINHYAIAPDDDGGTRHFSLAKYLKLQKWNTTIIASNVDHKTGKKRAAHSSSDELEEFENVKFLWINNTEYESGGMKRMLGMLHFSWRCLVSRSVKTLDKPDVVVGSTVHPFAALAALILSKKYNALFVFEIRDLWPQTLIDSGYISSRGLTCFVMRKLERVLISNATLVVTLLPFVTSYLESIGFKSKNVLWLPNGVDFETFQVNEELREDSEQFCLMYFGAHGQMNGLDTVVEALAIYKEKYNNKKVCLRMIGEGPRKHYLRKLATSLGMNSSDISFESGVAKNEIPGLSESADAFIISVLDLPKLYRYGISMNKLSDYMAAGKPVLIASAAANNPIQEADCGFTSPPEDAASLAENIFTLVNSSLEDRLRMGRNGRNYVEANLSYKSLANKLSNSLDEILT